MLDRILITNDDGIDAPGLAVLERIAAELAREVWLVAPERDQSGVSHAVSLHHPIRVSERGPRRYGITGTPGDCAVVGACHLMAEAPQLMLSGVNRGANLGLETVFSGTVGGANVRWDTAAALGADVVRRLLAIGWSAATCLNVNFPDLRAEAVGPLTLARQGPGLIQGLQVETRTDPRGLTYHWISFRRGPCDQGPESDVEALHAGNIVVTPLRYDRTDEEAYAMLAKVLPR